LSAKLNILIPENDISGRNTNSMIIMVECEICKKDLVPNDPFCTFCGSPVPGTATQSATPTSNASTQSVTTTSNASVQSTPTSNEVKDTTGTSQIGNLLLSDDSKIIIDDSQKLVGRVDLKEFSNDDLNLISRGHFTVYRKNAKFYINDGSTNVQEKPSEHHTLLNDTDITNNGPTELSDGDIIKISDVQINFKLE